MFVMKRKIVFLIIILIVMQLVLIDSYDALAQSSKPSSEISATPNNSNIVKVSGKGFNASETVTLGLWNETVKQYSFPENVTTDLGGNFSTIVIIPTSLRGNYFLVASTATSQVYVNYTVPDLIGATGVSGEGANNTLVYLASIISIASILISFYALTKYSQGQRVIKDQRRKKK
jgi:hypothetical protein